MRHAVVCAATCLVSLCGSRVWGGGDAADPRVRGGRGTEPATGARGARDTPRLGRGLCRGVSEVVTSYEMCRVTHYHGATHISALHLHHRPYRYAARCKLKCAWRNPHLSSRERRASG